MRGSMISFANLAMGDTKPANAMTWNRVTVARETALRRRCADDSLCEKLRTSGYRIIYV